jgi:hypothetical protein
VGLQVVRQREVFMTDIAFKGLFSCVNSYVRLKVASNCKGFYTEIALKNLQLCMDLLMRVKVGRL